MNRHKSIRNTRHNNKNNPQKKYRLGTVNKHIIMGGLKPVSWRQPHLLYSTLSPKTDLKTIKYRNDPNHVQFSGYKKHTNQITPKNMIILPKYQNSNY